MADITKPSNGLTPSEVRHLGALEKRIERGLHTFREVGEALMEIRDTRLYRGTHTSFEAYCIERWGLERQRAYQLIGSAEVMEVLGDEADVIKNEAQARELVGLAHTDPGRLPEVIDAVEGPMTAPALRKAVQQVTGHVPNGGSDERTSPVDRLIERVYELLERIESWLKTEPSPEDRAKVADALSELSAALK